jgi:hypothetical protein
VLVGASAFDDAFVIVPREARQGQALALLLGDLGRDSLLCSATARLSFIDGVEALGEACPCFVGPLPRRR